MAEQRIRVELIGNFKNKGARGVSVHRFKTDNGRTAHIVYFDDEDIFGATGPAHLLDADVRVLSLLELIAEAAQ